MNRIHMVHDDLLFSVCDRFFAGHSATQIAGDIQREKLGRLNREQVYPLLQEARRRGYLLLCPPIERVLTQRIVDHYQLHQEHPAKGTPAHNQSDGGRRRRSVVVANVGGGDSVLEHVTVKAAELALGVIRDLAHAKGGGRAVNVGLASGHTSMKVAYHLANMLRREPAPIRLVLHSLSSGFSVENPEVSSVSFFNFFHDFDNVTYVGLFAPPFVATSEYEGLKTQPSVAKSFEHAAEIDVVITSLASADDEHGELRKFVREGSGTDPYLAGGSSSRGARSLKQDQEKLLEGLRAQSWVGDVQYRPYSATGPLADDIAIRAVTLFDLPELVELASKADKAVILVAGPCGSCGKSRSQALKPLLSEPSLAVWSHVVMDAQTAEDCLPAPLKH